MLLLLQLQIVQRGVHGNSATATKLQTARSIAIGGAVKGSANFDGSGNVTINTSQNNIFVLTGSFVIDGSSTGTYKSSSKDIDFPTGLNKNNCILIAAGRNVQNLESCGYGYGITDLESNKSIGMLIGAEPFCVLLGTNENKIRIYGFNSNTAKKTLYYKIVLMKIS